MLLSCRMINFNNQKYFYEPYPHALYENVFDTPFYENLCDEFPSDQKFDNFDFDKQNQLKQKKFSLILKCFNHISIFITIMFVIMKQLFRVINSIELNIIFKII